MVQSKVDVSLGTPKLVSSSLGYHWYPNCLLTLKDGSLLLGFSVHPDGPPDELIPPGPTFEMKSVLMRSLDGGANWYFLQYIRLMQQSHPAIQLADGTVISSGGFIRKHTDGKAFFFDWRSYDNGATFEGPIETPVTFPEELKETSQSLVGGTSAGHICRLPIMLESGDILCLVDGVFKSDDENASRIMLIRSTDQGQSWTYHATVVQNLKGEGYCEPAIARLPNEEFVCIMRTGSGSPMYQTRSSDNGITWSVPISSEALGVYPCLLSMSNGILACSYGRVEPRREDYYPPEIPKKHRYYSAGDMVMFSVDGGRTWTDHTTIWYGPSTGYSTLVEPSPGELLCAYDVLDTILWDKRKNYVQIRPLSVTKKE